MAESHKDEDFGKDFLTSWNLSRLGKDGLTFDVETVSQSGKKFNFDKLVDFELGSNFDKLSSFKLEMPDLVFSTPFKKAEKENEKSSDEFVPGKKESKKDKFAFDFDFNELGKFDLGLKLLTGEKEATDRSTKCPEDIGTNSSISQDKGTNKVGNSGMNMDILQSNENKAPSETENLSTSRPTKLIGQGMAKTAGYSRSLKLTFDDIPQEVDPSATMHSIMTKENKEETTQFSKENKEQPVATHNARSSVENAAQGSTLLSASSDVSAPPTAYYSEELSMLDLIDPNLVGGQDNSMESNDSRHQRPEGKTEPPTTERVYRKYDRNVNECGRESVSHNESSEGSKDVSGTSATDVLQRSFCGTKVGGDGGEKKILSPNLLPSPMHRNFASLKSIATKERGSSSSLSLKPLNAPLTRKSSFLKSHQKPAKGASLCTANDKSDKEHSTDSFHLPSFNLLSRADTGSSSTKSGTSNLVSSCTHLKNPEVISSEVQHTAMKDIKHTLLSSMMSSRVAKLNGNIPSSTMRIEAKSVKFSEGNQDAPQNAISSKPYSPNKEKHVPLSPLLKRKTLEFVYRCQGSVTDLKALNPLKRIMESPAEQRKSPNISSKSASDLVPVTESQKALTDNTVTSTGLNVMGSISDFEMPSLVENDVNVEKAEACAKELDDICNMLKKKHEEAKELLVRAIVNNNALLMLNHPIYQTCDSFTNRTSAPFRGLLPVCTPRTTLFELVSEQPTNPVPTSVVSNFSFGEKFPTIHLITDLLRFFWVVFLFIIFLSSLSFFQNQS
ncbi:uncharacterized protein At4g18490 isoform X4 [Ananas comosus]|uniref:Uncharacterized protein At4g18490 isoform X4 n=1 Tax=Ananas comosus TaxID=4615 RepID=A0A6P5FRH7_ANACO|nr:uncharacterized protein At4g18490 isoform X4 [Ananas comosus]XP_020098926.1 uncharacterized protein At4g18490 isoform X4 [Ananas comosus]